MTNREIDALVAEKVMGWNRVSVHYLKDPDGTNIVNGIHPNGYAQRVPHYSTNIADACQALEKLKDKYNVLIISREGGWLVGLDAGNEDESDYYEGFDETLSMAICLAILNAAGVEI